MSTAYKVAQYIDNEPVRREELFEQEIHAVTFAFDRAVEHAGGDVSE